MKTLSWYIFLSLLLGTEQVVGRERWLERKNKPVFLDPRRFGQEQPPVLQKLQNACPGQVCGVLAGQAVTPLLAAQPECSQQDMADQIIDACRQFDVDTQANMIAIAKEYRQVEKNTPPDFSTNPPTLRNSVFCQKAPRNSELEGLVQAQDPANDPNVFFDPEKNTSVKKGAQPNTSPFGGTTNNEAITTSNIGPTRTRVVTGTAVRVQISQTQTSVECPTAVTVTVSGTNPAAASLTNAVTVTVGNPSQTKLPSPVASPPGVANFGGCSTPEIEFGVGFDNRKEASFRPVDPISYPHGSAQNIDIIAQFICDSLTNTCKANQDAKELCDAARSAASSATVGTGAQADAFNEVFGIKTDFADSPVDDSGNSTSGAGPTSSINVSISTVTVTTTTNSDSLTSAATITVPSPTSPTAPTTTVGGDENGGNAGNIGNFGSCSTPEIEFGAGFDGRRETSFRPTNSAAFDHGSDPNINLIAQFICGQLSSSCKADKAAQDTCDRATSAATNTTPAGSGAQADAFNAAFGIQTNFVGVQQIDNKGKPVGNLNNAVRVSNRHHTTFAARAVPIDVAASLSTVDLAYRNSTRALDVTVHDSGDTICGF
ncbi:hypothetical protein AGABI2DRAFT_191384 [Agaricus bisporus var. bisporus H97]|uniref:hypothetical protein n=1 Tax=Agaricus bisporus var. bisporus (strain H97 / ATCC MYA-4626 / FGSC 10389) TaxID=936046 RepID=UPI00029F7E0C|nr:hypothetical protein AGABI2DRAFT_191384 [Agaricus bisporus var. bisporus H97]EKV49322.1 hypothetical protein AGABI2DRAFT_191384 [Agaricus bisporus var. bisporus H97]